MYDCVTEKAIIKYLYTIVNAIFGGWRCQCKSTVFGQGLQVIGIEVCIVDAADHAE